MIPQDSITAGISPSGDGGVGGFASFHTSLPFWGPFVILVHTNVRPGPSGRVTPAFLQGLPTRLAACAEDPIKATLSTAAKVTVLTEKKVRDARMLPPEVSSPKVWGRDQPVSSHPANSAPQRTINASLRGLRVRSGTRHSAAG